MENDRLRSFNQTRVLTYISAQHPAWTRLLPANERTIDPTAPRYACLPVTNAAALPPGGCYLTTGEISESSTPYLIIQIAGVLPSVRPSNRRCIYVRTLPYRVRYILSSGGGYRDRLLPARANVGEQKRESGDSTAKRRLPYRAATIADNARQ